MEFDGDYAGGMLGTMGESSTRGQERLSREGGAFE